MKLSGTYTFAMSIFRSQVPGAVFEKEEPALKDKFLLRYLDVDLENARNLGPEPFDLTILTDWSAILNKQRSVDREVLQVKNKELALRLAAATWDQVENGIKTDWQNLESYFHDLEKLDRQEYAKDKLYLQQRHNRGVEAVTKRMEERLRFLEVKPEQIPEEYSRMRHALNEIRLGAGGKLCPSLSGPPRTSPQAHTCIG